MKLRDLFGVGKKLKESIFKNNNQINSTVATRAWILSKEGARTRLNARLVYLNEKMVVVPICLNGRCCSSGCVGNVLTKINRLTKY